jgi:ketosteroid isomerase-like protein
VIIVHWQKVADRIEIEQDAAVRRNLETVLLHMKAEAAGELETLLSTLTDDCAYRAHAQPDVPSSNPVGKDDVRRLYEQMYLPDAMTIAFEVDRVVADVDTVVTEGTMRVAYPGVLLGAMGVEVDDPGASYLYETRTVVLWPMDEDGRARGEESYSSVVSFDDIVSRKIRPEDLVLGAPAS